MDGLDGLLKCYDHNESFNLPDEFYEHISKVPHGHTGTTKCEDCGCPNCDCDPEEKICSPRAKTRCSKCQKQLEENVAKKIKAREKREKQ